MEYGFFTTYLLCVLWEYKLVCHKRALTGEIVITLGLPYMLQL